MNINISNMTEINAMPEGLGAVRMGTQRAKSVAIQNEKVPQHIYRIQMTQIGRIFTDIHYPRASALSAESVFYSMDNKPQRAQRTQRKTSILCALCVLCGRLILPTAKDFDKTTHRKGRKERKAMQQESLRPLHSLRLVVFFAPAYERAPPLPAVHLRASRAGG